MKDLSLEHDDIVLLNYQDLDILFKLNEMTSFELISNSQNPLLVDQSKWLFQYVAEVKAFKYENQVQNNNWYTSVYNVQYVVNVYFGIAVVYLLHIRYKRHFQIRNNQ
ncbi:uncharacterized protein SPAPADRAFT_61669 [Spathaspora passalidarum NRRL Y-27907]|uniref:Uncharacterized protein n=1 Tax=Spathaspora passalidarum (strain NRRL Y-27907 / 11-Y1) TaxID=619300 RepID=G3ANY0_SPAPN|nr:uncharacterized protein SPAPADRAFT_61669 [Spathaspora passalidarum NRRL Y-27907]EGW32605.1 hypothetical protein SPAPADRAFT_61669 [Spathaspora passalidarum NRRL Y-27907]